MRTKENDYQGNQVLPDTSSKLSKKEQVAEMFNDISGKYDFLNHFFSMGIDRNWRKKAIASLASIKPQRILDVATGTGDLAIAAAKLEPKQIIGVDIAVQMLEEGKKKIERLHLSSTISLQPGDSEALPFPDNSFDAVTCAYGIRNFENLEKGLSEMCRVMASGGRLAILEFSRPRKFPIKQFYYFYFKYILPFFGRIVSKHKTAYSYLPESVMVFPEGKALCQKLVDAGFSNPKARPLAFGITTLYTAEKE